MCHQSIHSWLLMTYSSAYMTWIYLKPLPLLLTLFEVIGKLLKHEIKGKLNKCTKFRSLACSLIVYIIVSQTLRSVFQKKFWNDSDWQICLKTEIWIMIITWSNTVHHINKYMYLSFSNMHVVVKLLKIVWFFRTQHRQFHQN